MYVTNLTGQCSFGDFLFKFPSVWCFSVDFIGAFVMYIVTSIVVDEGCCKFTGLSSSNFEMNASICEMLVDECFCAASFHAAC
jgi:hypothetical protein